MQQIQNMMEGLCITLGLGAPWDPPGRAGGHGQGEGPMGYLAQLAATVAQTPISEKNGWIDGWSLEVYHTYLKTQGLEKDFALTLTLFVPEG